MTTLPSACDVKYRQLWSGTGLASDTWLPMAYEGFYPNPADMPHTSAAAPRGCRGLACLGHAARLLGAVLFAGRTQRRLRRHMVKPARQVRQVARLAQLVPLQRAWPQANGTVGGAGLCSGT